jgi:iron complex outermembrane receptor protein
MRYIFTSFLFIFSQVLISQYTITGKVQNQNDEYLELAVIYLENTKFAAVTDSKGRYKIENVPAGTYSLKVSHTFCQPEKKDIEVMADITVDFHLEWLPFTLTQIDLVSNRLDKNAPFRHSVLQKSELDKNNLGSDIPSLLQHAPSMLVTTDAGHGIGYSSLSIRGSDQTRVNVSINGVPVNDAESQNVFWVNMPDLISSAQSVQIQRGVGSSANGPGAFAGSVLINTRTIHQNPYLQVAGSGGSFGTLRGNVAAGTGLMNDKYYLDGRYSYTKSDGFIDRASARLNGLYLAGGMLGQKSSLRFQVVSGKEITYQAWNGVPEARFTGNQDELLQHYERNIGSIYKSSADSANLFTSDHRYNYYRYENQVDNYRQTQSQLTYSLELNPKISLQATGFYTFGTGFFEQFRFDDDLADYGLENIVTPDGEPLISGDLARRRWLRNHFYGLVSDMKGKINDKNEWQAGIYLSRYDGSHFGEIVKTWFEARDKFPDRYYDNQAEKNDFSAYIRYIGKVGQRFQLYGDIQLRNVQYNIKGLLDDRRDADIASDFLFLNPKIGTYYTINQHHSLSFSMAVAHKEPARSDFTDHLGATNTPDPERLQNYELTYLYRNNTVRLETGMYYMNYKNQLVLNGNLNDVGAPLRINVPESYRLGWDSDIQIVLSSRWSFAANYTLSKNRIIGYSEVLYDYTNGFDIVTIPLGNTPISYSPSNIASGEVVFHPVKNISIAWISKYVSEQFLDNSGNSNRKLPAFHVHNTRLSYESKSDWCQHIRFTVLVNNILNRKYANNGYTYSYIYDELITENFVFPQAGIHGFAGFEIRF